MKNIIFVIGSFCFLWWYMPLALMDNRITFFEGFLIGINVGGFIFNSYLAVSRAAE